MTRRNRKSLGIEPIVAAILLIVITVVAAVLLYMWFSGYLTATTSKVGSISTPEQFQVVAANLSANNGLRAYVQNTGSVTINITGIYVLNATTGNVICRLTISSPSNGYATIYPGSTVEIITSSSSCVSPGKAYELLFVTSSGTRYSTFVTASS